MVVELSPLSREAVTALLGRTLVTPDPDSMLRAALLERSEGNPFYLVSYLRSLLDDRTAVLNGGQVRLSIEPDSLQLPDSMHAVVGERVDRLDAAGKSLLRLASVIGRRFSLERLFDFASSMQFRDSAVVLEDLRTRQLIEKAGVGHVQFTHAVVQDVVYAGMLGRERRRLHLAFASTLAAQMNPDDAVVAWHLEQAGEMHDASVRYEAASERAQAVYAHLDALAHVERAFALTSVDEASRRPRLVERAGDLLLLTGRFLDATERFSTIADDSTDLDGARCNRKYAHALMACQRADQAVARIAVARGDLADIPVNARGNAWWREHFAVQIERLWLLYQTASEDMRAVALQLAPELEAHGLPVESGLYHRSLALLELRTSRYLADESVVRLAERGARELATADDRTSACFANFTHAFTLLWSGDIVAADRKLHDVLDEARRIGDAERHLMCLTYLAVTARFRHDVDGARAFATAGVAAARTAGARLYEGVNSANLAWADWRVQRASPDQSRVQLDAAVALMASTPGYPFWWIATLLDLALVQDTEDVSTVASLCESLIVPSQQRLPDPLAATMTHVVTSPSLENVRVVCDAAMLTGHL